MCLIFELFLLRGVVSPTDKARGTLSFCHPPTDRQTHSAFSETRRSLRRASQVVAWGAFPLVGPDLRLVEGRFKVRFLAERRNPLNHLPPRRQTLENRPTDRQTNRRREISTFVGLRVRYAGPSFPRPRRHFA